MTSTKSNDSEDVLLLDPPSFQLPDDFYENPSDYEIWSLRVPVKFNMSSLSGKILHMPKNIVGEGDGANNDNEESSISGKKSSALKKSASVGIITKPEDILTSFQIEENDSKENDKGETYSLCMGQISEVQSYRILCKTAPHTSDDDDEEEGSTGETGKEMKPLNVTFDKHIHLIHTTNANTTELDLTPSVDRAPHVDMIKEKMRIPYTHIEQKKGLKRRWNMFGSNAVEAIEVSNSHSRNTSKTKKK
mmetsp:Transcript_17343/g.21204  ORF Transcript_17343/g.21204 Transcript_17343/m.21204 type:complete len:248 (+) Transcript_17343:115-858(+)